MYETPVGIVEDDEGFLIALVYGRRTSWLRNVMVAGEATVVHEGRTYAVTRPEVIQMEPVIKRFAAGDRRSFRLLGISECLRLRQAGTSPRGTTVGTRAGVRRPPVPDRAPHAPRRRGTSASTARWRCCRGR
jgi:hypothetical protein